MFHDKPQRWQEEGGDPRWRRGRCHRRVRAHAARARRPVRRDAVPDGLAARRQGRQRAQPRREPAHRGTRPAHLDGLLLQRLPEHEALLRRTRSRPACAAGLVRHRVQAPVDGHADGPRWRGVEPLGHFDARHHRSADRRRAPVGARLRGDAAAVAGARADLGPVGRGPARGPVQGALAFGRVPHRRRRDHHPRCAVRGAGRARGRAAACRSAPAHRDGGTHAVHGAAPLLRRGLGSAPAFAPAGACVRHCLCHAGGPVRGRRGDARRAVCGTGRTRVAPVPVRLRLPSRQSRLAAAAWLLRPGVRVHARGHRRAFRGRRRRHRAVRDPAGVLRIPWRLHVAHGGRHGRHHLRAVLRGAETARRDLQVLPPRRVARSRARRAGRQTYQPRAHETPGGRARRRRGLCAAGRRQGSALLAQLA